MKKGKAFNIKDKFRNKTEDKVALKIKQLKENGNLLAIIEK